MFAFIFLGATLVSAQAPVYLQAAAPAYQYLYPLQQQQLQYYQAAPAATCVPQCMPACTPQCLTPQLDTVPTTTCAQQCMPACTPQCLTPQRDEELPTPPPEVITTQEATFITQTTTVQPDTIPCKCLIKITVTQGSSTYTRCSSDSCTCPPGYNKCNTNCCRI